MTGEQMDQFSSLPGTLIRYRFGRRVMVDLDELDDVMLASSTGLKSLHRRASVRRWGV